MTLYLKDSTYENLKAFEPKYCDILAKYLWYRFNVLGANYDSFVKAKTTSNGRLSYKSQESLEISKSDFIDENRNESNPESIILKDASIVAFLKKSKFEYAFFLFIGWFIGIITALAFNIL